MLLEYYFYYKKRHQINKYLKKDPKTCFSYNKLNFYNCIMYKGSNSYKKFQIYLVSSVFD